MRKIFHLYAKLLGNDSDIHKAFGSMNQSVTTKIRNAASDDWIAEKIVEQIVKIFQIIYFSIYSDFICFKSLVLIEYKQQLLD